MCRLVVKIETVKNLHNKYGFHVQVKMTFHVGIAIFHAKQILSACLVLISNSIAISQGGVPQEGADKLTKTWKQIH